MVTTHRNLLDGFPAALTQARVRESALEWHSRVFDMSTPDSQSWVSGGHCRGNANEGVRASGLRGHSYQSFERF